MSHKTNPAQHATVADILTLLWQLMHDDTLKPSERLSATKEYTRLRGFSAAEAQDTPPETFSLHIHLNDE